MEVKTNIKRQEYEAELARMLDGSLEVESVSGVAMLGPGQRNEFIPCARVPGFDDTAMLGRELECQHRWSLLTDPPEGGYVFLDLEWPEVGESRRIHVDLTKTTRRMLAMIATISGNVLGVTGVPRPEVPNPETLMQVTMDGIEGDDAFRTALFYAQLVEEVRDRGRRR